MYFISDFVCVCMWFYMGACLFDVYSLGYIIEVGFLLINLFLPSLFNTYILVSLLSAINNMYIIGYM
jgi:hypothetical protein